MFAEISRNWHIFFYIPLDFHSDLKDLGRIWACAGSGPTPDLDRTLARSGQDLSLPDLGRIWAGSGPEPNWTGSGPDLGLDRI